MNYEIENEYREWIVERIEGETGSLYGEYKGIFSLDTKSLEKLYRVIRVGRDPEKDFAEETTY